MRLLECIQALLALSLGGSTSRERLHSTLCAGLGVELLLQALCPRHPSSTSRVVVSMIKQRLGPKFKGHFQLIDFSGTSVWALVLLSGTCSWQATSFITIWAARISGH